VAQSRRNFTILDAMVVVGAIAISIAWTMGAAGDILRRSTDGVPPNARFPLVTYLMWWIPIMVPCLAPGTVALFLLQVRGPRPERSDLSRRPGFDACASVTLVLALQVVLIVVAYGLKQVLGMTFARSVSVAPTHWAIVRSSTDTGVVVVGAWLVLTWGRWWSAEASWLDRAGRFLGICWIALFLVQRTVSLMMAASP